MVRINNENKIREKDFTESITEGYVSSPRPIPVLGSTTGVTEAILRLLCHFYLKLLTLPLYCAIRACVGVSGGCYQEIFLC